MATLTITQHVVVEPAGIDTLATARRLLDTFNRIVIRCHEKLEVELSPEARRLSIEADQTRRELEALETKLRGQ